MIRNYINIPIFIVSFIIGIIVICFMGPDIKKVFVYPTPENVNDILFQDTANNCFEFYTVESACPADKTKIMNIPIQI